MNILITGGLGHIGSGLIEYLSGFQHINIRSIYVLDNFLTQRYCSLFNNKFKKIKFYEVNILKDNIEYFFKNSKISHVVHLAAITDATNSFNIENDLYKNNLGATKIISRLCEKFNTKMIFISSTSIYGKNNSIVDEKTEKKFLKPQSPYAICKLKEEDYLLKRSEKNNLKIVIFRFGTICGISKGMRFHTAINKFCYQTALNKPITIWETAFHQKRPYLSLHDAYQAIYLFLNKKRFNGQIYNVVTENLKIKDIVDILKIYSPNVKINFVKSKIMNQLSYDVSSKKIEKIGFKKIGNIKKDIYSTLRLLGAN